MIFYLILGLALLLLAVFFAPPVIRFLEAHPEFLIGCTLFYFIFARLLPEGVTPSLSAGGISVYIEDLLSLPLVVLVVPFLFMRLLNGFSRADIPLLLLLAWSSFIGLNFLLGVKEFGIQKGTNEFRSYFYVISVVLYVASLPIEQIWGWIERFWIYGAFCLFAIAAFGFLDGDLSREGRPLGSSPTLFILQAVLIALFLFEKGSLPPILAPLCAMLLPMVVLLQHRSVWVVAVFAFFLVFKVLPAMRMYLIKWGTIGLVVCAGLSVALFGGSFFEAMTDSFNEATSTSTQKNNSSFVWRLQTWGSLITGDQLDSGKELLIGNPFGTGWERKVMTSDGVEVTRSESPHNYYLQTLLRSGFLGLAFFITLHVILVRQLIYRARVDASMRSVCLCLAVLIASQMLYYTVYASTNIQAVLLGAGIACLRRSEQQEETFA